MYFNELKSTEKASRMCTASATGVLKKEGHGQAGSPGRRDLAEPGTRGKTWMKEDAPG